ncbi:MAG: LPS assembly lipoprotein LptE [Hyphomicrobiaceae bacterium]
MTIRLTRRSALYLLGATLSAPILSACGFQPLYGTTAAGTSVGDAMAAIDIAPIPGRVGQQVRNELIFKTTGGGLAAPPRFNLDIAIRESARNMLVQLDGNSNGVMYSLDADFKLVRVADKETLLNAKASSQAAFQKVESIFANIRARRDAEDRAARVLADSIRTRVAAFLSTTT